MFSAIYIYHIRIENNMLSLDIMDIIWTDKPAMLLRAEDFA